MKLRIDFNESDVVFLKDIAEAHIIEDYNIACGFKSLGL